MIKRIVVTTGVFSLGLLLFAGCANTNHSPEPSNNKTESTVKQPKTVKSNPSRSIAKPKTTTDPKKSSSESTTSSNDQSVLSSTLTSASSENMNNVNTSENQFPYSVALSPNNIPLKFKFSGFDVPDSITINNSSATSVTILAKDGTSEVLNALNTNIPTKQIRIFSANSNKIRTVNVNTQITLEGDTSDNIGTSGPLYLFYNRNGGISLATPNYAGNVSDDQKDVMLEVLQN